MQPITNNYVTSVFLSSLSGNTKRQIKCKQKRTLAKLIMKDEAKAKFTN